MNRYWSKFVVEYTCLGQRLKRTQKYLLVTTPLYVVWIILVFKERLTWVSEREFLVYKIHQLVHSRQTYDGKGKRARASIYTWNCPQRACQLIVYRLAWGLSYMYVNMNKFKLNDYNRNWSRVVDDCGHTVPGPVTSQNRARRILSNSRSDKQLTWCDIICIIHC